MYKSISHSDVRSDVEAFVRRCMQNCLKGVCVLSSLRLIVNTVIELETPLHQSNKTVSQNDVMELLFTGEPNFFASMVQNIKEFKQDLLARIRQQHSQLPANEPELEELLNQQCTNKCTYIENIQKRIEFLIILEKTICMKPQEILCFMVSLWNEIVESSILLKEKNIFYKWMTDLLNSTYGQHLF